MKKHGKGLVVIFGILSFLFITFNGCGGEGCGGRVGGDAGLLKPLDGGFPNPLTKNLGVARFTESAITAVNDGGAVQLIASLGGISQGITDLSISIGEDGGLYQIGALFCPAGVDGGDCGDSISPKCLKEPDGGRIIIPANQCCACVWPETLEISSNQPDQQLTAKVMVSARTTLPFHLHLEALGFQLIDDDCELTLNLDYKNHPDQNLSIPLILNNEPASGRTVMSSGVPSESITLVPEDFELSGTGICGIGESRICPCLWPSECWLVLGKQCTSSGCENCTKLFDLEIKDVVVLILNIVLPNLFTQENINGALDDLQCQKCHLTSDCSPDISNPPERIQCEKVDPFNAGTCKNTITHKCIPVPIGIEGAIDVSDITGGILKGVQGRIIAALEAGGSTSDMYIGAHGVNIKLIGEAGGDRNKCVPETCPPCIADRCPIIQGVRCPASTFGELATVIDQNDARICYFCSDKSPFCPLGGTCDTVSQSCKEGYHCPEVPFMVGIGINQYMAAKALWSAFDTGALCISLASDSIPSASEIFNANILSFFIPELTDYYTENASAMIVLRPQNAPELSIGKGTVKVGSDGKVTINDPLVTMNLKQVSIDLYISMFDRQSRIATITTDISVPMGMQAAYTDPARPYLLVITPVMGTISFLNSSTTNYELLEKQPDLISIISSLISQMLPQLLKPIEIDTSTILKGYKLDIQRVMGQMPVTGSAAKCSNISDDNQSGCRFQYLAIFGSLIKDVDLPGEPEQTESISHSSVNSEAEMTASGGCSSVGVGSSTSTVEMSALVLMLMAAMFLTNIQRKNVLAVLILIFVCLVIFANCGSGGGGIDAGNDAGTDASEPSDASFDSGSDAGTDASHDGGKTDGGHDGGIKDGGSDGGQDGGCDAGWCPDGGALRPPTTILSTVRSRLPVSKLDPGTEADWGYYTMDGSGEPHQIRDGLQSAKHASGTQSPSSFYYMANITDPHIVDFQSPNRLIKARSVIQAAFKAAEGYSVVTLDAVVKTINMLHEARIADYGVGIDSVVITGDGIDNSQYNELRWFINTIDGRNRDGGSPINPNSGNFQYDPLEMLNVCRPVDAEGLESSIPWYFVIGNHDLMFAGNFPCVDRSSQTPMEQAEAIKTCLFNQRATGNAYYSITIGNTSLGTGIIECPLELIKDPTTLPDGIVDAGIPDRRMITHKQFIQEFFKTETTPIGHGFDERNQPDDNYDNGNYKVVLKKDASGEDLVWMIALDFNYGGPFKLGDTHYGFITHDLIDNFLVPLLVEAGTKNILVILISHAASWMIDPESEVSGYQFVDLMRDYPNVILHMVGHDHWNQVYPHASGKDDGYGYYEVEVGETIEWGEPFRMIEFVYNNDNTGEMWMTVVNHCSESDSPAWQSRFRAIYDVQHGFGTPWGAGDISDRNVRLRFLVPPGIRPRLAALPRIPVESKNFYCPSLLRTCGQ